MSPIHNSIVNRELPRCLLKIRIPLLAVLHVVIFTIAYAMAFFIRFDGGISEDQLLLFVKSLPVLLVIQLACFWTCKTFHGWWRYVTFRDLVAFAPPLFASYFAFMMVDQFLLPYHIPRSIPLIQVLLAGLMISLLRSSWRIGSEFYSMLHPTAKTNMAFIVSNHHEILVMANQINCQQGSSTKIVGILTYDKSLIGAKRAGIPIVGTPDAAPELAKQLGATQVWFAAGSLPGAELSELKQIYDRAGLITKVIPWSTDRNPGGGFIPLREIDINDLLRRPAVKLDDRQIFDQISGSCVMVTGAGGSIGSELCRQLLKFEPSVLVLVEHRENSVFLIHNELQQLLRESENQTTQLIPAVADILDADRMEYLFGTYKPQYVYHAAAHKHVGLMEINAGEALKNNILGTKQVADLAHDHAAVKFVLVSTDKAVNPTSVMGCTKQMAERYVLSLGSRSDTKYVVVRFGNVLGSNGSVVPIFKEQIARGGPITITDDRMTRYFMTIPEASQLIVQAGSMGQGGEIFVLDMGQPVKIVDLAKTMIDLAGLPPEAIEIQVIGARPGEKLYEELYFGEEESLPTTHQKIFAAKHRKLQYEDVLESIEYLLQFETADPDTIRTKLKEFIPEYQLAQPEPVSTSNAD